MIAQLWRGSTRAADRHAFASLVQARIRAVLAGSEACRGAYVLQREVRQDEVETLVLTLHAGAPFASDGEQAFSPVALSEAEKRLLVTHEGSAARYAVLTNPGRTLLYADLARRFPLRIMAPR